MVGSSTEPVRTATAHTRKVFHKSVLESVSAAVWVR